MSAIIDKYRIPEQAAIWFKVVERESEFDALKEDWQDLYKRAKNPSSPLLWEWQRTWWASFGAKYGGQGSLRILTLRDNKKLVGILPLYLKRSGFLEKKSLYFISTGEDPGEITYPENLNLLYDPLYLEECLEFFGKYFFESGSKWNKIDFGILEKDSPLLQYSKQLKKPYQFTTQKNLISLQTALQEKLPELQKSFRRVFKQKDSPGLQFQKAATLEEALNFFDSLVFLHSARWQMSGIDGAFSSPQIIAFHKSLIRRVWPSSVSLFELSLEGEAIAIIYGYVSNDRFEFYQCGINFKQKDIKSPGILAHLLSMEELRKSGIKTYDFLSGEADYKVKLSTSRSECIQLQIHKLTPSFVTVFVSSLLKRVYGKSRRDMIRLINRFLPLSYRMRTG
jgi:CelD/BcsL family acetyltransferase involved in cellulose biosynthesis